MSTPACRTFAQGSGSSPATRDSAAASPGAAAAATAAGGSPAALSGTRVVRLDSTIGISQVVTRARPRHTCD